MPQPSISYACGRVGVLRRNALHTAQLERLQSAKSYGEALRALTDIGFAAADTSDFQMAADQHVRNACELIRAVTPNPAVTDSFLLRYDVHNLKVLVKARYLAQKPTFLSACGTLPIDKLRHAVAERNYAVLPAKLKQGMSALEKRIAVHFDPMLVDTELDKAMYRQIFENLASHQDAGKAITYFRAKVDLQNFMMLLRLHGMGKDAALFQDVALEGGTVPLRVWSASLTDHERLARQLQRYSQRLYQAALAASLEPAKLPAMEKEADDYLYSLFQDARYASDSLDVLLSYLLQKQREATDVRLILAGKLNGFAEEAINERMRELNG